MVSISVHLQDDGKGTVMKSNRYYNVRPDGTLGHVHQCDGYSDRNKPGTYQGGRSESSRRKF